MLCTLPGRGRYLEGEKTALFRSVNTHRQLTERPIYQNNVLGMIVPDHDEAKKSSRGADITLGSSASDVFRFGSWSLVLRRQQRSHTPDFR
jgi:hypothetical protein